MHLLASHAISLLLLMKKITSELQGYFTPHESVCPFSWTFQGDFES